MYIDVLADTIAAIMEVALPIEAARQSVSLRHRCSIMPCWASLRGAWITKKRSYKEILHQDLFDALGMKDTAMGVRRDLKSRHLIPEFRNNYPIKHLGHKQSRPRTVRSRKRMSRCPGSAVSPPRTT